MTINAATGAKLFIGGVQTIRNPVLADYQADSYLEVGEIETLGNFGDKSAAINFTSLADARVRKLKGPRDAGNMAITVGDDPNDEGQQAMIAAEQSKFDFNFYVMLNDAQTEGGMGSLHYFYGKVMSQELAVGTATNVVKRNLAVDINSPILPVDPT